MTVQRHEISTGTNCWGKYLLWNNLPRWNLRIPAKDKWKQFLLSQEFHLSLVTNTVFPMSGSANETSFVFFLNWKMSVNEVMHDPTPVRHQGLAPTSRRWQSDTKTWLPPLILTPLMAKVTELEMLEVLGSALVWGIFWHFPTLSHPRSCRRSTTMRNPLSWKTEGSFQPKAQTA